MKISIQATGLVVAENFGEVSDFEPRKELPNRKHLKLMSRADRLGVAAVGRAVRAFKEWEDYAPERRGLFVGSTPEGTDPVSLSHAISRSVEGGVFSEALFGDRGVPYVPPLWLVRGLSNNVLGFACAYWNIQGVNGNRCEGRVSGLTAIIEGMRALNENRADVVIAGGADSLLRFAPHLSHVVGEGAGFVLMTRGLNGPRWDMGLSYGPGGPPPKDVGVDVGAATGILHWIKDIQKGSPLGNVEVRDDSGLCAWLRRVNGVLTQV